MAGMAQTPASPPPLPDLFDIVQARRWSDAARAGDDAGAERARRYLVDEGSTSPEETEYLDQFTRAMHLAQAMVAAGEAGDAARREDLAQQVAQGFDPAIVRQVQLGMLFAAGRQQGWLPERDYDALAAAAVSAGAEVAEQMRHIRRGQARPSLSREGDHQKAS